MLEKPAPRNRIPSASKCLLSFHARNPALRSRKGRCKNSHPRFTALAPSGMSTKTATNTDTEVDRFAATNNPAHRRKLEAAPNCFNAWSDPPPRRPAVVRIRRPHETTVTQLGQGGSRSRKWMLRHGNGCICLAGARSVTRSKWSSALNYISSGYYPSAESSST
jgi:hypothetical protein